MAAREFSRDEALGKVRPLCDRRDGEKYKSRHASGGSGDLVGGERAVNEALSFAAGHEDHWLVWRPASGVEFLSRYSIDEGCCDCCCGADASG